MKSETSFFTELNTSKPFVYTNVVILFLLVNALFARLDFRWDLTRGDINSLTASTEKVLEKLDDPILIEAYISRNLPGQAQAMIEPILYQLGEIDRIGGDKIRLKMINPVDEKQFQQAQERGIQAMDMDVQKDIEETTRKAHFGIYIQSGDKSSTLSLVAGGGIIEDFEYQFLKNIKTLVRKEDENSIGLIQGPGLASGAQPNRQTGVQKDSLYIFRYYYGQEGNKLIDVNLSNPVPETITTLLLAGLPRLEESEIYHLDQFLMNGGNLVLMLKGFDFRLPSPNPRMRAMGLGGGGQAFANVPADAVARVNAWLGKYGVSIRGEIIYEYDQHTPTFDLEGRFYQHSNPVWGRYSPEYGSFIDPDKLPENVQPAIAPLQMVIMPWFSGLDIKEALQKDVKFYPLIHSSPGAVSATSGNFTAQSLHTWAPKAEDKRVQNPVPLVVYSQGKFRSAFTEENLPEGQDKERFRRGQKEDTISRLVVIGSPYMVSDIFFKNRSNQVYFSYNYAFLSNLLEVVQGDSDLSAARLRKRISNQISRKTGKGFERFFQWLHILLLPAALGIFGTLRLVRRNQRLGLDDRAPIDSSPDRDSE